MQYLITENAFNAIQNYINNETWKYFTKSIYRVFT